MVFIDCKVQKIVSFLLRFKEAVQDCKELRTPDSTVHAEHIIIILFGGAFILNANDKPHTSVRDEESS